MGPIPKKNQKIFKDTLFLEVNALSKREFLWIMNSPQLNGDYAICTVVARTTAAAAFVWDKFFLLCSLQYKNRKAKVSKNSSGGRTF